MVDLAMTKDRHSVTPSIFPYTAAALSLHFGIASTRTKHCYLDESRPSIAISPRLSMGRGQEYRNIISDGTNPSSSLLQSLFNINCDKKLGEVQVTQTCLSVSTTPSKAIPWFNRFASFTTTQANSRLLCQIGTDQAIRVIHRNGLR